MSISRFMALTCRPPSESTARAPSAHQPSIYRVTQTQRIATGAIATVHGAVEHPCFVPAVSQILIMRQAREFGLVVPVHVLNTSLSIFCFLFLLFLSFPSRMFI